MTVADTVLGYKRIDPNTDQWRAAYETINANAERSTALFGEDRARILALESRQGAEASALSTTPASGFQAVTVGGYRVLPDVDAAYAAFPGACVLADGRVLMVWREGADHVNAKDGVFKASRSADNGLTWSTASTFLSLPGIDLRDPSVSTSPDRSVLYLSYFKGTATNVAAGCFVRRSTDQGATWGDEYRVDPGQPYAALASPIVTLPNGLLLATWYGKDSMGDARESVYTATSPNGGITWGEVTKRVDGVAAGADMQEPWAFVYGDRVVIMYRHGNSANIGLLDSINGGATWSAGTSRFAGTGRPSFLITRSGTIVCLYRRIASPQHGVMRTSRDMGATWSKEVLLERADPAWWTYSAPVEVARGQIFCATSIEESLTRARLSIRYLTEGGGASPFGDMPRPGAEKVLDRASSIAALDDFDRPPGPLGFTTNGQKWYSTGGASIVNGVLLDTTSTVENGQRHAVQALTPDVDVEVEFQWTGNAGVYVLLRYQDDNNYWMAGIEANGTQASIYKVIAGVTTRIGAAAVVAAPAGYWHRIRALAVGPNVRLYFEDALVCSGSDTSLPAPTRAGVRTGGGSASTVHRVQSIIVRRRSGISS